MLYEIREMCTYREKSINSELFLTKSAYGNSVVNMHVIFLHKSIAYLNVIYIYNYILIAKMLLGFFNIFKIWLY